MYKLSWLGFLQYNSWKSVDINLLILATPVYSKLWDDLK